jgi:hypothetical protein
MCSVQTDPVFTKKFFCQRLVESMHAEPADTEGQLYTTCQIRVSDHIVLALVPVPHCFCAVLAFNHSIH